MAKKQVSVSGELTDKASQMLSDFKVEGWSENGLSELTRLLKDACKAAEIDFELGILSVKWDHLPKGRAT